MIVAVSCGKRAMHRPVDHFGPLTIFLHWSVALLIVGVLFLGLLMARAALEPGLMFELFQWHKSFGMLALLLSALRLLHSLLRVRVPAAPGGSALERRTASAVHGALLSLALVVPLTGWLIASASPLGIPTFAFNAIVIPHLPVPKSDAGEALWTGFHAVLAYAMLGLVLVHSAAALHHHYVRHDPMLRRMLGSRAVPEATCGEHRS